MISRKPPIPHPNGRAMGVSREFTMTSSNGIIFCVTGHLCGEFTGLRWIPTQRPVTRSFDVFFDLRMNERLSKHSWDRWLETPSCPLWHQSTVLGENWQIDRDISEVYWTLYLLHPCMHAFSWYFRLDSAYWPDFGPSHKISKGSVSWWRHQIKTFSALQALCAWNSPVPGEFPTQRPVTRSFDVFFDLRLNQRLSKQSWGWWFETLSCPLWRQCNV